MEIRKINKRKISKMRKKKDKTDWRRRETAGRKKQTKRRRKRENSEKEIGENENKNKEKKKRGRQEGQKLEKISTKREIGE